MCEVPDLFRDILNQIHAHPNGQLLMKVGGVLNFNQFKQLMKYMRHLRTNFN